MKKKQWERLKLLEGGGILRECSEMSSVSGAYPVKLHSNSKMKNTKGVSRMRQCFYNLTAPVPNQPIKPYAQQNIYSVISSSARFKSKTKQPPSEKQSKPEYSGE